MKRLLGTEWKVNIDKTKSVRQTIKGSPWYLQVKPALLL